MTAEETVAVRLLPLPPKTMLASGMTLGSEEALFRVKLLAGSSASPMVKGSAPVDWFTRMV